MSPISICLLLPIACVVALPSQYSYYAKDGDQQELSNEFWSKHFGPDFQHALHFQLGQTDVIDNANAVGKNSSDSTAANKKRSTYIVHKSQMNDQNIHEAMGNSMRVHLLQPEEMEALEREMLNYARGNGMMQSPVVVNLPESEGSLSKNPGQEKPVVLNLPPIVYHSGHTEVNQRHSTQPEPNQRFSNSAQFAARHGYSQGSFYDQMHIPFQTVSSYGSMHSAFDSRKLPEEEMSPPEIEPKMPLYAEARQKFEEAIQPQPEEKKQQDEAESQSSSKEESKV